MGLSEAKDPTGISISKLCGFFAGFVQDSLIRNLLKEGAKMSSLDHPNILTLIGICVDGGPVPLLVLPFMFNGCLRSYLRKEKANLVLSPSKEQDSLDIVRHSLLRLEKSRRGVSNIFSCIFR